MTSNTTSGTTGRKYTFTGTHAVPEWVIVNANRYAIGRASYIVADACQFIINLWPSLSDWARDIIRQDVEEAFARDERLRESGADRTWGALGMGQDRREWEKVRQLWTK